MKSFWLVLLIVLLQGCGWHLRGAGTTSLALTALTIDGASPALRATLLKDLQRQEVAVHDGADSRIAILSEHWQSRTVAVDTQGRAVESELRYTLQWQYQDKQKQPLAPAQPLTLIRHFQQDPANANAANSERQLLRKQLYVESARLLQRQLKALLQATADSATEL